MARQELGSWLASAPWDVFVTLTDPGMSHPEAMAKRARYLEAKVNDDLYGKGWKRKGLGIETVTGLELQKRGSVHAHCLWRLPDHDARDPVHFSLAHWQRFASDLGGHAWLQPPRDSEHVCGYVTKYVLKDGEILFSPTLNPWHPRHYSGTLLGGGEAGGPAQRVRPPDALSEPLTAPDGQACS
jgi:hypothetical protein